MVDNMNIQANPNATNSEMDSKTIIKSSNLTNDQFGELVQQFVELQVDNMDTKTMMEWITDELIYQYGKLTPDEFKERVDFFDEGLYDELVDNVTTVTYGLAEGETLSFPVHSDT